ncbi:MAG TPA: serine/threonine-protein kinase [Trichormus sp.]
MRSDDKISQATHKLVDDRDVIGHILGGKYQVLARIGQGGMGAVYRVRQVFFNRDMALKMLDSARVADAVQLRRFQQEGIAANSLNHPSLVRVHDVGLLDNGQPYLVMDLVEGETLADYLKRNGPMPLKDISSVFAQTCFGLSYAHGENVIHRDIKPGNIMLVKGMQLDTEGSVKIVDFGLAKIAGESEGIQELTRTGEVMGSPIYMSPEQCSGGKIDYRSDIYSLGCVLFEALTGTPPLIGETALRTMMLHQTERAPTLKEASLGREYPAGLERIVATMLAKSPRDRYEDLGIVAHELSAVCTGSDLAEEPKQPKPKRPMPTLSLTRLNLALVLLLTNALAIGLTIAVTNFSFRQQRRAATAPQGEQESRTSSPPKQPSLSDPVGNALVNGLAADSSWTSKDEPPPETQTPHEYQPPIISTIVSKGGIKMRQFNFPKSPIGMVTNSWQGTFRWQSHADSAFAPISGIAESIQDYPASVPLTLDINLLKFPNLLKHGDVYSKIGPNEFAGLMLNGCPLSDGDQLIKEQTFLRDVMKQAINWKSLQAIGFRYFDLRAEDAAAIDTMESLETLELDDSTVADQALKNSQFMQRVRYVFAHGADTEELARAAQGSKNLYAVAFNQCDCSAKTFEYLRGCSVQKITVAQPNINDDLIKAIANLHGPVMERINCPSLTASQVKVLLHSSTLQTLCVTKETLQTAQAAGIVDRRLIGATTVKQNDPLIPDIGNAP